MSANDSVEKIEPRKNEDLETSILHTTMPSHPPEEKKWNVPLIFMGNAIPTHYCHEEDHAFVRHNGFPK